VVERGTEHSNNSWTRRSCSSIANPWDQYWILDSVLGNQSALALAVGRGSGFQKMENKRWVGSRDRVGCGVRVWHCGTASEAFWSRVGGCPGREVAGRAFNEEFGCHYENE
jgi:hypothetical protein